jgi:hypothetical protein
MLSTGLALPATHSVAGHTAAVAGILPSGGLQRDAKEAIIRTMLMDIAPASLGNGTVLFHEHLSMNMGAIQDHVEEVLAKVKLAAKAGVS